MKNFKSGYVGIVGRPNVGKSTIMNSLLGQKIAIISAKPQTTRSKILSIMSDSDSQVVFLDTPGFHDEGSGFHHFGCGFSFNGC